jgi:hypothetical protein
MREIVAALPVSALEALKEDEILNLEILTGLE